MLLDQTVLLAQVVFKGNRVVQVLLDHKVFPAMLLTLVEPVLQEQLVLLVQALLVQWEQPVLLAQRVLLGNKVIKVLLVV